MSLALFFLTLYGCSDTEYHTNAIQDSKLTESRNLTGCPQTFCFPPISKDTIIDTFVVNGCVITVEYVVEVCPTTVSVRDFVYTIGSGSACDNINQVWNQYYLNGQSILANEALNSFYRKLTLLVQNSVFNNLDPADFDPNIVYYDFQWIETKCHTMCVDIRDDGEGGVILGGIYQVECGEGCCARTTQFIFDPQGEVDTISSEIRLIEDCEPIRVRCDYTYNPEDCQPACARL
jgi:hypothetical protein